MFNPFSCSSLQVEQNYLSYLGNLLLNAHPSERQSANQCAYKLKILHLSRIITWAAIPDGLSAFFHLQLARTASNSRIASVFGFCTEDQTRCTPRSHGPV